MLLVLIAVALATVLSATFLTAQSTTQAIARNAREHLRAQEVAESGLETVIQFIRANTDWRSTFTEGTWMTNQAFAGGSISVATNDGEDEDGDGEIDGDGNLADDLNDPVTITVVGSVDGRTHRVQAVLTPTVTTTQTVLLVVPNAASLNASDTARQAYLEGLGWTVTLLSETASQDEFDTATEEVNAVYVSASVTSTSLASKVVASELGAVIEAGSLFDNVGACSSAPTSFSDSQISVTTLSHFITSTLPATGATTVLSSSQPMQKLAGTIAVGVTRLAAQVGAGSTRVLAVIEEGDLLAGGGTAAGRRAFMPWGGIAFDFGALNDTGKTILQRALTWAAAFDDSTAVTTNRIAVKKNVTVKSSGKIDSYLASAGAYGPSNNGSAAVVTTNSKSNDVVKVENSGIIKGSVAVGPGGSTATGIKLSGSGSITGTRSVLAVAEPIPTVSVPTDIAGSSDITHASGTTTISESFACNKWTVSGSAIVQISGNVTIICKKDVKIQNTAQIKLLSGASLILYCKQKLEFSNSSQVNVNTASPSRMIIYLTGNKTLSLADSASVYAHVVGPGRKLKIEDSAHLHGSFRGKEIEIDDSGILSMDASSTTVVGGSASTTVTYVGRWIELE